MDAAPGQLPVGTVVGEYQITGLLGEGGMGVVYSGIHPVIGKEVAIKVLSPNLVPSADIVGRFIQEARAVNHIGHPNIIDIFAFGESPELGHYFVMPRLNGEDLRHRIARVGPLPLGEAIAITEQICDALEAAHEKGIFHRDLKPDNVFLVPRRRGGDTVKVLDFGIAKLSEGGSMTVTRTGAPMGTPLFMSPEQWEAVGIDHRTDIYALGILFQFMITGRFPFESESQVALMRMHCDQAPTLPSAYGGPPAMDPPVARALAKNANDRFPTSGQFIMAVKTAATGAAPAAPPRGPVASPAAPSVVPTQPSRSFVPWMIGAGLAAIAAVVAVIVIGGSNGDGDGKQAIADEPPPPALDAASQAPVAAKLDAAPAKPDLPPAKKTVRVGLSSNPRGAEIVAPDGKVLGKTPAKLDLDRADEPLRVVLKKKGYEDKVLEVARDSNTVQIVELSRIRRGGSKNPGSNSTGDTKPAGSGDKGGSAGKDKWGNTTNPFD